MNSFHGRLYGMSSHETGRTTAKKAANSRDTNITAGPHGGSGERGDRAATDHASAIQGHQYPFSHIWNARRSPTVSPRTKSGRRRCVRSGSYPRASRSVTTIFAAHSSDMCGVVQPFSSTNSRFRPPIFCAFMASAPQDIRNVLHRFVTAVPSCTCAPCGVVTLDTIPARKR
jgi:hypothetical protein